MSWPPFREAVIKHTIDEMWLSSLHVCVGAIHIHSDRLSHTISYRLFLIVKFNCGSYLVRVKGIF